MFHLPKNSAMKKTIYFSAIFILISCGKPSIDPLNFSLLNQFDWQSIEQREVKNIFDTSKIISYSDTSVYTFNGQNFISRYQSASVFFTVGTGGNSVNQKTGIWEGDYKVNPNDSSIIFFGKRRLTVYDNMSNPGSGKDSIFNDTAKAKILLLNEKILKLEVSQINPLYFKDGNKYIKVIENPGHPIVGGIISTYYAIKMN